MPYPSPESDVYSLREQLSAQLQTEYQQKLNRIRGGQSFQEYLSVQHSHDYPLLLKHFTDYLPLDRRHKKAALHSMFEHECLHAVPALGFQDLGLDVRYGVFLNGNWARVEMMPLVMICGPTQLDLSDSQGQAISLICFESAINPVLVSKKQSFSNPDRIMIAGYLKYFQMLENLHQVAQRLFTQLPKKEQKTILHLISLSEPVPAHSEAA